MFKLLGREEEIIKMYNDGNSVNGIAKDINVSFRTVWNFLKNNGVEIRDKKIAYRVKSSKEAEKYNQFESINSEYSAYFLGLLLADGAIYGQSSGQRKMEILLEQTDSYILEEFRNYLGAKNKLYDKVKKNKDSIGYYKQLIVTSDKLCNDLEKLGVYNEKMGRILPEVSEEMLPHLVRGFFDGDGCISHDAKQVIFTSSSKEFMERLKLILVENNLISEKITIYSYRNNKCFSLSICNRSDIEAFMNFIYKDSTIYFERKRRIFNSIY